MNGLAHRDRYHLRLISAEVKVRGRTQPVALYELLDEHGQEHPARGVTVSASP